MRVEPGEVAIKVDMYGGDKGVQTELLPTGRNIYNAITHDVIVFPTYIQQKDYEDLQFQDRDGLILTADVTIAYKFAEENISKLYEEYRKQPHEITEQYFPAWIRDAMVRESAQMKVDKIYGEEKEKFRISVRDSLRKDFLQKGIVIDDIYFTTGIEIPASVKERIDSKIKATQIAQQKENELQATQADVAKQIAVEEGKARSRDIEARSRAAAITELNKTLTPTYLEFRKLEMLNQAIEKWNGVQPLVVSESGLILDMGQLTNK